MSPELIEALFMNRVARLEQVIAIDQLKDAAVDNERRD